MSVLYHAVFHETKKKNTCQECIFMVAQKMHRCSVLRSRALMINIRKHREYTRFLNNAKQWQLKRQKKREVIDNTNFHEDLSSSPARHVEAFQLQIKVLVDRDNPWSGLINLPPPVGPLTGGRIVTSVTFIDAHYKHNKHYYSGRCTPEHY